LLALGLVLAEAEGLALLLAEGEGLGLFTAGEGLRVALVGALEVAVGEGSAEAAVIVTALATSAQPVSGDKMSPLTPTLNP